MHVKQPKRTQPGVYRGQTLITDANISNKIREFANGDQFYQVDLAQVRKVLTEQDVNSETYPRHQFGAIKCRLLYTQQQKQVEQLITMIPRDAFNVAIPVVGQIVICSKHPSNQINVTEGPVFDQYYYFGTLNVLNRQNNNSISDVSSISKQETPAQPDEDLCGDNFYVNDTIDKIQYQQGDVIISGRFGHSIKFTNNRGASNKQMLPSIVISNQNSKCFKERVKESPDKCGSSISLINLTKEPETTPTVASGRKLLDGISPFSLIGNSILQYSDRIILNARTNDLQLYAKKNIEISAVENIFLESKNFQIQAKSVKITVGSNQILISESGVTINSTKILLGGLTQIKGITAGSTPGFCSLPVCAFSGAPHTVNIVGSA